MSKAEIASCLSITAFTDILARLTLPTIFDKLRLKKRIVFWTFSILVGIGRSSTFARNHLLFILSWFLLIFSFWSFPVMVAQSKGTFLIVTFVIIGFLRGATLVNLNLTVSEYCSLSKLPSAFGMFMVFKGLFVIILSPLIGRFNVIIRIMINCRIIIFPFSFTGYIRDASKSYAICIHVMTLIISTMFVTWSIEFICKIFRKGKSNLNKKTQDVSMEWTF